MTRQITQRPRHTDPAIRLREYLRIGRAALPHCASLTLQRRSRELVNLPRFVAIARGRTA